MPELLLLTIAISLDSLAVGATYGLRRIALTPSAYAVVGLTTAILLGLSMAAGTLCGYQLPASWGHLVGASILGGLGCWHVLCTWVSARRQDGGGRPLYKSLQVRMRSLGLVVEIRFDPTAADKDHSGVIDMREAFALGAALGLDALAAGVGAAMAGISLWIIPLAACACVVLVMAGHTGTLTARGRRGLRWPYSALPGSLLIAVALYRLWG